MRQLFEHHPVIAYRFIPGLQARVPHEGGGYLVRTNACGFRSNHEFISAKPPGVRRLLVFGDSFTAGDGVSNGKRWTDLLETMIPGIEVFNFGLSGTGTDQHWLIYREFARGIECDGILIASLVENIRRVNSRYRPYQNDQGEEVVYAKPYFVFDGGRLQLRGVPVPKDPLTAEQLEQEDKEGVYKAGRFSGLRRLVNKVGLRDVAQKLTRYQPLPEYDNPDSTEWKLMRAVIAEWVREVPQPVLLVPIPLNQYIEESADPSNCVARYRELAEELRCQFHDPLIDLRRYSPDERRAFRFPVDIHPSPAGHAALARSIAPAVARLLGVPAPLE